MTTTGQGRSKDSLRAEAFYNEELRDNLEPAENGKFIVIDVRSSDYEVHADLIFAYVHLRDRRPNGELYTFRVGDSERERSVLHGKRMTHK